MRSEFGAEPGFIGPLGSPTEVLADEALRGLSGLVAGANKPMPRDRRRAGTRLRAHLGRRSPRGGGRPLPGRKPDSHRAGHRGRQHLRAGHTASPTRSGRATSTRRARSSSIWMGLVRASGRRASSRPRSSSSQTTTASRRRVRSRPSTWSWSTLGKPGEERARSRIGSTTSCATSASTCSTTTATPAPARSSPTRSCWVPLRVTIGKKASRQGRSRCRCAAARRRVAAPRGRRGSGCGAVADPPLKPRREPLTFRRLSGLDRSGGPPPDARRGEPLNPGRSRTRSVSRAWRSYRCFLVVGLELGDGAPACAFAAVRLHRVE